MAILFEDHNKRLTCSKCGMKLFYEKPVYSYVVKNNHYEAQHVTTHLVCVDCGHVEKSLQLLKDTIIQ